MENKELNRISWFRLVWWGVFFFSISRNLICVGASPAWQLAATWGFWIPFITFAVSPPTDSCLWITVPLLGSAPSCSDKGLCLLLAPHAGLCWSQRKPQVSKRNHQLAASLELLVAGAWGFSWVLLVEVESSLQEHWDAGAVRERLVEQTQNGEGITEWQTGLGWEKPLMLN